MLLRKKQKEKDTMSEITLQQLAAQAASIQDDLDASTAALRAAEVEAIKAIVSSVLPRPTSSALRSVVGPIQSHYKAWWVGNTHTDSEEQYLKQRGLRVVGNGPYAKKDSTGNSGSTKGTDIFLQTNGTFLKVVYDGYWSSWQGSTDEWATTVSEVSVEELVESRLLTAAVLSSTLTSAFTSVIEGRAKYAAESRRKQTEQLKAVTTLLKK